MACVLLPTVRAQAYHSQPMLGVNWTTHEILVQIPEDPSWARIAIEGAMTDWKEAQVWFIQTYFTNDPSAEFLLVQAENQPSPQVSVRYVNYNGQAWAGTTEVPTSGAITNETVLIILNRLATPDDLLQVAEHEFGHVLGLDYTAMSQDLTYPAIDSYVGGEPLHPSTLNLYAVYLLGIRCTFSGSDVVVLPSQIPYLEWYQGIRQQLANSSNALISTSANERIAESSSPKKELWQQPSFIMSTALALAVLGVILFKSRPKKPPRPSQFLNAFDAIGAHRNNLP